MVSSLLFELEHQVAQADLEHSTWQRMAFEDDLQPGVLLLQPPKC